MKDLFVCIEYIGIHDELCRRIIKEMNTEGYEVRGEAYKVVDIDGGKISPQHALLRERAFGPSLKADSSLVLIHTYM